MKRVALYMDPVSCELFPELWAGRRQIPMEWQFPGGYGMGAIFGVNVSKRKTTGYQADLCCGESCSLKRSKVSE